MLDHLDNLKYIFLANSIGIFSGYLLSVYIDNKFFDEAEFNIKKAILWGIGVSLFLYAMDFGVAALNYYLSSTFSTNLIFFPYDSLLGAFGWGFYIGIIFILIKFFELLFASKNSN